MWYVQIVCGYCSVNSVNVGYFSILKRRGTKCQDCSIKPVSPYLLFKVFRFGCILNFHVVYLIKRQLLSRIGIWLRKETRMNKIYTLPEIQSLLTPVFTRHGVRRAILFGSYAKGIATEHSDVDFLVDSGLCGLAFYGLLESVVSALKIPVDLIDVTQVEKNSPVDHEIRKSGVPIFGQ